MEADTNPIRIQAGCQQIMRVLEKLVDAGKLNDPEALACLATVLGILLATTDEEHRERAKEMTSEIINNILTTGMGS